jgi:hypothetical protein
MVLKLALLRLLFERSLHTLLKIILKILYVSQEENNVCQQAGVKGNRWRFFTEYSQSQEGFFDDFGVEKFLARSLMDGSSGLKDITTVG